MRLCPTGLNTAGSCRPGDRRVSIFLSGCSIRRRIESIDIDRMNIALASDLNYELDFAGIS
jgi:hypothetical protein